MNEEQFQLTGQQRDELTKLVGTTDHEFLDRVESLVAEHPESVDAANESFPDPAQTRKDLRAIATDCRMLKEKIGSLHETARITLALETEHDFAQLANEWADAAENLAETLSEIPIPRGTPSREHRDFLIRDLVREFRANSPDELWIGGVLDFEYRDRCTQFVDSLFTWAEIPHPAAGDTKTQGEQSQGRLRRMVKEILRELDQNANLSSTHVK